MYFNLRNIGLEKNLFTLVLDTYDVFGVHSNHFTILMADGHEVLMLLGFPSAILLQISQCDVLVTAS